MRQAGLVSVRSKKPKGSTTRAKEHPLAPDLVERDFSIDGPDRLWVADFDNAMCESLIGSLKLEKLNRHS